MSKKGKSKDVSRLRAEVEFLRAQLKNSGGGPEKAVAATVNVNGKTEAGGSFGRPAVAQSKNTISYRIEPGQLRSDLRKTFLLTVLSLAFLFALYFSQPFLPAFFRSVGQLLQNFPLRIPAIK